LLKSFRVVGDCNFQGKIDDEKEKLDIKVIPV
jgi:hypothetical protein